MLTHVPGYNVTTDSIRSKTVKDSYVKWDAGLLIDALTTTSSSLTLDNAHDSFYINNSNSATISVTILNTINDYTANSNTSIRRINVIIDSRSAASDRTVTFTLPNTFTLIGGLSATRNLYHGNLQVFVVEIVNNTVNIYDGVGSYFEADSNGDLMPLNSSADLVPRTDLTGQIGTGDKRWAKVYAGNITNTYDNVAAMVADTSLKNGGTAFTKGYYAVNDGGAGLYTIREAVSGETYNKTNILLDNGNVAECIDKENYLPFGYTRTTYTKSGVGSSKVYYAIIPAEYKPQLSIANDTVGAVENAELRAYKDKSSLTINAGTYNMSTNEPTGIVIQNGEVLHNNDVTEEHGGRTWDVAALYMLADGTLGSILSIDTPTTDITALNPVWAVQGWYPIIENGENVSTRHSDDDYQPLTCIGQDYDGNYFVMVCEGRSPSSIGMSLRDVYAFVTNQLGLTLRFLYNLDGGGSSSFVYHGIRRNKLTEYEDRPVANFITFRKKEINNDDAFANMYSIAKIKQIERQKEPPYVADKFFWYSNNNGLNGIDFYSVDKSTHPYTYTRRWLLGPDYNSDKKSFSLTGRITQDGGNSYIWGEIFRIQENGNMLFLNAYNVPTKPRSISLTWNSNITIEDSNICKYGDLMCLHAKLTISAAIAAYSTVFSGLPYMHSNYMSIPLFNISTGSTYRLVAHYNGSTTAVTTGTTALPAGTYILDTNFPIYNH